MSYVSDSFWSLNEDEEQFVCFRSYDNCTADSSHPKKRVRHESVKDFNQTPWGKILCNPNTAIPTTEEGKEFRRRFRVPFPLFKEVLVPLCIEHEVFGTGKNNVIPVGIKVMVALRILGRGLVCDDIKELASIGLSTANNVFKQC